MALKVDVKRAGHLPDVELLGKSDPYTAITFRGKTLTTKYIDNSLDPRWNETLEFPLKKPLTASDLLGVQVFDYELIGQDRLLGQTQVPLRRVARVGNVESSYPLAAVDGSSTEATITLSLSYKALSTDSANSQSDRQDDGIPLVGGTQSATPTTRPSGSARGGETSLPNRPLNLQLRFHIIEARGLLGENLNPTVKVVIGEEAKSTQVAKGTQNPIWDETLVFSGRGRLQDLLSRMVDIRVYSSRMILRNTLIGSFNFDVGLVYDEPDHAIIHKWLLLTDPDDVTSEAKGYLKVSVNVLPPGATAKHSPLTLDDDATDVEHNLWEPVGGAIRQSATLSVCVFRAEDIPQMDPAPVLGLHSESQEEKLADPYATVSVCGHIIRTDTAKKDRNPKWNEQLNFPLKFPVLCDRVKLQLLDEDSISDDCIGTALMSLSQMSVPGKRGLLPTFGPVFVNMYGSPREFSTLTPASFEDMNKGKREGVAYRGRVLVSMETTLGTLPTVPKKSVNPKQLQALHLQRKAYLVYAVFLHAGMISPVDEPVQFEVSIGNYGNMLDKYVPGSTSRTPPSNPVYDGNRYYYLPWFDSKPCVQVESHWEDNTYRIGSLNIMLSICRQLEAGLCQCKAAMDKKENMNDAVLETLQDLQVVLKAPLPTLPTEELSSHGVNNLDVAIYVLRKKELESLLIDIDAQILKLQSAVTLPFQVLEEVEDLYQRLTKLATEPQISVPDVVISMISGGKHIAFARIPAHRLMYQPKQDPADSSFSKIPAPSGQGDLFGRPQTVILKPPSAVREITPEGGQDGCAQVEVILGLGLASQLQNSPPWSEFLRMPDGQAVVFAETYQNEARKGSWGTAVLSKPKFSDIKGQVNLPLDSFSPPAGWRWEGVWYIGQPPSSLAIAHKGTAEQVTRFVVLEYKTRSGDSNTDQAPGKTVWKDEHGNLLTISNKEELKPRDGMEWASDWVVAMDGAVDEGGWQYASSDAASSWMASAQRQHQCKRRKWIRTSRKKTDRGGSREPLTTLGVLSQNLAGNEGWEYSRFPFAEYHPTHHLLDLVRRRRLLRRMVEDTTSGAPRRYSAPPVFRISTKKKGGSKDSASQDWAPLMFISFPKSAHHTYQMRAYVYQARNLYSSDKSGLSTPYGIVSFIHKSDTTTVKEQTINPVWSQIVVLDNIILYGPPEHAGTFLPPARIEFFDEDVLGRDEYLGVSVVPVSVCLDGSTAASPQLQWHPIKRWEEYGGETLVAAILFLKDEGIELPDVVFPVPTKEFERIEMLCLGVRDLQVSAFCSVKSPLVELGCGGQKHQMDTPIRNVRDFPNFPNPFLTMDVEVPVDLPYAMSLDIRLLDQRMFGWKPLVGVNCIEDIHTVIHDSQSGLTELTSVARVLQFLMKKARDRKDRTSNCRSNSPNIAVLEIGGEEDDGEMVTVEIQPDVVTQTDGRKDMEEDFDWWNKFYASLDDSPLNQQEYKHSGYDRIMVYTGPLEDQFDHHFQDLVTIYPLYHGKGRQDEKNIVGKLKAALRVHPIAQDEVGKKSNLFAGLALSESVDCLVRVYIVRAIDLQPADRNRKADPYICVKLGRHEVKDKENYVPNELNPVFGKVYELPAHLPTDNVLKVIVMDYDHTSAADLIGETTIDLENRYLTQHGAACGLPETFSIRGFNKWRSAQLPVDLLADWAEMSGFEQPRWNGATEVVAGGQLHRLVDFEPNGPPHKDVGPEDQRLALHVLRQQGLVPEHVETRPLYNPLRDTVQGQVQMWVDIFPNYLGDPPPPVAMTPWQPKKYELRVVIYNTQDVLLDEISVATGEAMSDIYVKGWLPGQDEPQKTDVHYRSLDGEGNFNWRLVFPFEYIPQEKVMVVKKKEHFFSLDKTERKLPPRLSLQIWDNDVISSDDILGSLEVDLLSFPQHAKSALHSSCKQLPETNPKAETVNLFKKHRMRGWWPILRHVSGGRGALKQLAGKIEMEVEILTEQEAKARPAARGRGEPNQHPFLSEPKRPATSFLWLTSPWKSCKFIVWKYYKWHIIAAIALLLAVLLVAVWIYTIPGTLSNWMTSSILQ